MITVQDLIREREEASSVAYQEFVLYTTTHENSLFCFFENKDAPYYHLRIKINYNGAYEYIPCGNKKSVLKVYELIKNYREYDKYKLAFFVDRDFDNPLKDLYTEIYETPSYSIENLYCSIESMKEFIKTDLQIRESEELFSKVIRQYTNLQKNYLESILLFNAWYKLQKIKRNELNEKLEVKLTDTFPSDFVEISLEDVTYNYDENKIILKYPNHLPYTDEELQSTVRELECENLRLNLRGKYVFSFMTTFIRKLIEDGADVTKRKILDRKIKYNMDNSTSLTLLTTYAESPDCLSVFLKRYN